MLGAAHAAQLVNYLAAAKIDHGLLINFGAPRLEFRTKTRLYPTMGESPNLQD
jgi:GxxExxY protein